MRAIVAVALLAGCSKDPVDVDGTGPVIEPTDLRRAFPDPPAGGLQWVTPEYVIEPYAEVEYCWFGTYTGPTVGLHAQWTFQSQYGHHVVLNATNAEVDDYPDDTVLDCTDPDALPMTSLDPLLVGGTGSIDAEDGPEGELLLPDGMAVELEEGQRIILQSHYVNVTDAPLLVQDALNLALVDPATVETWTAPFVHVETDLAIAQGHDTLTFDCTWPDDYDLLFLAGHMHEWGSAFEATHTPADGSPETTLYAIEEWDPLFRDTAPVNEYVAGEMSVRAGDVFTTHCEWDNDTDHVLGFPEEMCVTFGMAYPLKVPIVCDPD